MSWELLVSELPSSIRPSRDKIPFSSSTFQEDPACVCDWYSLHCEAPRFHLAHGRTYELPGWLLRSSHFLSFQIGDILYIGSIIPLLLLAWMLRGLEWGNCKKFRSPQEKLEQEGDGWASRAEPRDQPAGRQGKMSSTAMSFEFVTSREVPLCRELVCSQFPTCSWYLGPASFLSPPPFTHNPHFCLLSFFWRPCVIRIPLWQFQNTWHSA